MAAKRIVLITGANSGIGFTAVKALWESSSSYLILAAGRSIDKLRGAISEIESTPSLGSSAIEAIIIDVTDDDSITKAVKHIDKTYGKIDALVNNAGGSFDESYAAGEMTLRESWKLTMDLNVVSPQVITNEFAALLLKSDSPRLLMVTSGMSSLVEEHERRTPGEARARSWASGWPKEGLTASDNAWSYRVSKAGLNMVFLNWVRIFEPDGVKCFSISPGFLATRLAGDIERMKAAGAGDARIGGNFIKDVLEGLRDADANQIVRSNGSVQPW